MNWFSRLKSGLFKTAQNINSNLTKILSNKKLDEQALEEIEDLLISSDMGITTSNKILSALSKAKFDTNQSVEEPVKGFLRDQIAAILKTSKQSFVLSAKPHILVLCGVNGNGKTTTAGKLAMKFSKSGKKVMLAACDTFRAAAVEQLVAWGQRADCPVITGAERQDPASVVFQAVNAAIEHNIDLLIIDTAGRLHNNQNLMAELEKSIRVIQKINDKLLQDIVMVLDGSTGQNAIQQLETFQKHVNVTGVIVTKLDGSAKGGVLVALADKHQIPIYAIGVGESIDDINDFDPEEFAKALIL